MRFKGWQQSEGGGFLLLSLLLHGMLIACFWAWGITHAVSAAEGPQLIEVALVVDNALPTTAQRTQAAAQKAPPALEKPTHDLKKPSKKPALAVRDSLTLSKKPFLKKKQESPSDDASAPANNRLPPEPISATAQAAQGSQSANAYAATLLAWLNRHKRYPPEARAQHRQGRAILWLSIEPDGTIADSRIEQSTGAPLLDEAIMQMVQHSNPAPPPPGAAAREAFRIPVVFTID